MVDAPSLSREETVGLVVVLTPIGIMSWYSMGSLALHSRILTLVLSLALAAVAGVAVMRWLN